VQYKEVLVISALGNKEKRNVVDKNAKWPINEIRKDYLESLKRTLRSCVNPILKNLMFSSEVKRNIQAVSMLIEGLKTEFTSLLNLFDLLCKWIITKMIDQVNVVLVKKILEFLESFFNKMIQTNYQLQDFEAASIIPILCEKLGTNNTTIKAQIKNLLNLVVKLYHPAKVANNVIWTLDSTRNKKTKLECLMLIGELVKIYPESDICSIKNIKSITKYVMSIESSLRNEALELISIIHKTIGDSFWMFVGELPENVMLALKKKLDIE
jgi:hypothetical protein